MELIAKKKAQAFKDKYLTKVVEEETPEQPSTDTTAETPETPKVAFEKPENTFNLQPYGPGMKDNGKPFTVPTDQIPSDANSPEFKAYIEKLNSGQLTR